MTPKGIEAMNARDTAEVVDLCKRLGFGFVMHEASKAWAQIDAIGSFTIGPCRAFTEPCACGRTSDCDLCYGCGWQFKVAALRSKGGG